MDMKSKAVIWEGDFFKVLEKSPYVGKVDLVLTSPPYFTARNYGGDALFGNDPEKWEQWCFDAIVFLASLITDTGVIWWNTGSGYKDHQKLTNVYSLVYRLHNYGLALVDEIPWIKSSASPKHLRNRPFAGWEHNYVFAKNPEDVVYNKDAVRRPYTEATLKRMQYRMGRLQGDKDGDYGDPQATKIKPHPNGASVPNYLVLPQDYSKRPHPAPMTPALANWVIKAYSPEGGLVLDPMAGAGTTMIESVRLGRDFIGCELYKEYIDIANLSLERLLRDDDPYNGLKKEWESLHEQKN